MKYFSMFSGIGGFEYGIEAAYLWQTSTGLLLRDNRDSTTSMSRDSCFRSTPPENIGYSEIDKYAIQIYEKHYGGHKNYGDATRIIPEQLPDFDLLCGGFPCQAFSIAGKRRGFDDTRGTLFFDILRVCKVKKPQYLLLENVKGLLNHDSGRTFQTIIKNLTDIGYLVQWQVLNSKNFGVPQNRERVFIIGHLGGKGRRQVFPIGENSVEDTGDVETREIPDDIAQAIIAGYAKNPRGGGGGSMSKRS